MKRLTISGYVSCEPKFNTDNHGKEYAVFTVDVLVGMQEVRVDSIDVICSGNYLLLAKDFKVGCKVFIEGELIVNATLNDKNQVIVKQSLTAFHIEILVFKTDNGDINMFNLTRVGDADEQSIKKFFGDNVIISSLMKGN